MPHSPVPATRADLKLAAPDGGPVFAGPHALLPVHKVRYVGEPLAMVVAETPAQAADAAEAVLVDYEPLPWVTDSEAAAGPGAPVVWDDVPGNVCVDTRFGGRDGNRRRVRGGRRTSSAWRFASAGSPACRWSRDRCWRASTPRPAATRCARAATVRCATSTRSPRRCGRIRRSCASCVLTSAATSGTKNRVYSEFGLTLWAARKLGRPVKFTASRSESFLSDYQARDLKTRVELALSADGRFLGYRAANLSNVGAWAVSFSPLGKGIALVTGGYAIPAATARATAVFTNTVPTNAYRSSGRPEVTHALERVIDTAAHELGLDPIELRRRNLVPPHAMPYTNPLGVTYDSGEYENNMDRALALVDWSGFARRAAAARARGKRLGRGFAHYVESSIGAPAERTDITP